MARVFDGYEHRPGQFIMADLVAQALTDSHVALIEAPTGTGKTVAYLVPAIDAGRHVVISTGTKALQEQIAHKDIKLVERLLDRPVRAVTMKGRRNYLCPRRFDLFQKQPTFVTREEIALFAKIFAWSVETKTGDRAEIADLPDDCAVWNDICSTPEFCAGGRCPAAGACFITKMRARAANADIVIVNHHLLFADLSVRQASGGEGMVLPDYDAVVCDEAHQLESTATSYFGASTSSFRFDDWERDLRRGLDIAGVKGRALDRPLKALREAVALAFEYFAGLRLADERLRPQHFTDVAAGLLENLSVAAKHVVAPLESLGEKSGAVDLTLLARRLSELALVTDDVCGASDPAFVYWRERRPRTMILHKDPIDLGEAMRESLFAYTRAVVFTSATLTTQKSFDYFKTRLGVQFETLDRILPTCFDYPNQGLLYVPREMPDPREEVFLDAALEQIMSLVLAAGGRSFCLFTSIRNMEAAHHELAKSLPFPCYLQGQAPKHELLEIKRREPESVLFATASFWEGVDIPGDALRCVIIDKLPFASPSDPIVAARIEKIEADGGQPFMDFQLPAAIIMLKQGLGRLIRTARDRGVLALLDSRVQTKGYGRRILASLPPFRRTSDLRDAREFLESLAKNDARS